MRYKLGELISKSEVRNIDSIYGITDVRGISNNKEIQPTKANVVGRNFDRFRIVDIEEFVFNRRTTRMGEKIQNPPLLLQMIMWFLISLIKL